MAKLGENDLEKIMRTLSKRRSVFHSEADFQHELAFELREHLKDAKDAKVRLEYPYKEELVPKKRRRYTDIVVFFDDERVGIEVKYALKGKNKNKDIETIKICGEEFKVSGQGAQTNRKKSFDDDKERIEKSKEYDYGYAIMITNIKSLSDKARQKENNNGFVWNDYVDVNGNNALSEKDKMLLKEFKYLIVEIEKTEKALQKASQ